METRRQTTSPQRQQQQQQQQHYGSTLMGSAASLPVLASTSSCSMESSSGSSAEEEMMSLSTTVMGSGSSFTTQRSESLSPSYDSSSLSENDKKLFVSIGPFDDMSSEETAASEDSSRQAHHHHETTKKPWKQVLHDHRKIGYSLLIWYIAYMIMGIVGGTVAFMHFPRTNLPYPHTLPDYGYDLIPYWCPRTPLDDNIQSMVLMGLYMLIFVGVWQRWNTHDDNHHHPPKANGKLILQQLLHMNALVFLTRTTTVCVTGLPQPNPRCANIQAFPVNYFEAFQFVIGRGFPPRACGDLIYSGHVACTLTCMTILHKHFDYMNHNFVASGSIWAMALLGIYATLSCRSHYTVDVVLAFYFIFFLREYYFLRSQGIVKGPIANFIQWLEITNPVKNDNTMAEEEETSVPLLTKKMRRFHV